jgi:hypothetical protein
MRLKTPEYLINNSEIADIIENKKKSYFYDILSNIDGININEGEISFYTREINREINEKYILSIYNDLRVLYGLKPVKQLGKKIVSTILVKIAKELEYEIENSRKYYAVSDTKRTTQGHYRLFSHSVDST